MLKSVKFSLDSGCSDGFLVHLGASGHPVWESLKDEISSKVDYSMFKPLTI